MTAQIEVGKEIGSASQQSGFQDEAMLAKGIPGNLQTIKLQLVRTTSYFSKEEKDIFVAAAMEGEIGQTHYTNPDADMRFRCPLCAKVLNPTGLAEHTARHFLRMRNTPNGEYLATLHEEPWKQIRIQTGGITAGRSGADPPPISRIHDHVEQVGRQLQLSQSAMQRKVLKPTSKQKVRTSKKKRRPSGQQTDRKVWGSKGATRCLKRQTCEKSRNAPGCSKDQSNKAEWISDERREPNVVAAHPEQNG